MEEQSVLLKPFHESIVDIITKCTRVDVPGLAAVIIGTKISENHDAIISALAKKAGVFERDYMKVVNSVIVQKPVDYKLLMDSAKSLEEALEIGFDVLPLGSRYLGPQGRILLIRNMLLKADPYVAEICIMDAKANDNKILLTAGWGANEDHYHLQDNWPGEIRDLSDKW